MTITLRDSPHAMSYVADAVLRERVKLGAQLLDERLPYWVDRVDVDALEVDSRRRCVLAQATGLRYDDALSALDLSFADTYRFGFALPNVDWQRGGVLRGLERYERLTEIWRELIERRRATERLHRSFARSWFGRLLPRRPSRSHTEDDHA